MTPEISQALAVYRRQRVKPMGGMARSGNAAGPDLAKIEQEAFESEAKRQEQQANVQAAEQEAAAKAALKAQNDAAEARYRAEGRPFYTNASGQILPSESDEQHAAKTQHKAVNDAKASEYFQMNRPFRRDMQGNVVPRHTDEEWQAQKATKQAALEAAQIDKANKAHRDEVRSGIDQQQAVLSSNDDLVQRRTQELQLTAENARAEVTKRKRFVEDAKKRLDAMDPADTQFETVAAAMEKMQAEIEQHQAAADAADDESRRQQAGTLAWQKEQDVLKGRLRQEEAGVDALVAPQNAGPATGITTPGTPKVRPDATSTPGVRQQVLASRVDALAKNTALPDAERKTALTKLQLRAKDPVAYETAAKLEMEKADAATLSATLEKDAAAHAQRLAEIEAKAQALTQERDALTQRVDAAYQRAQQRLNAPHTAGELVTVPGPDGESQVSMPRDVAEGYMEELARLKQWQDSKQAEADVIEIEVQEANLDARVINEGQKVLRAKQGEQQVQQMREHEEKLGRMARGGMAGPASKIKELSADLRARRAVIEEMYPEGGPEHDAAVEALKTEASQREQAIQKEMGGLQRFGAMLYDRFKDVSTNFIDRSTTDAEGIEASDTTNKIIDDAAKAKGLNPEDVRRVMETRRVLDWSKPLSGTAARMDQNVMSGLWEKEFGPIEAARLLPDGGVVPNPMLGGDKAAFDKALAESGASKKAQAEAQKLWPEYQRRFGEAAVEALMQEPDFAGSFSDYREQMIREDQATQGKLGFARKEPWEQALQYLEGRKGRRFDIRALELVRRNVIAGFGDIATQLMGAGAMVTGNEDLSQAAAQNAKNMQSLLTGQEFYGPKGLAAGIAAQTARMAPGMAAIIGTGSLGGATVAGGIQTAGSQYADTYGNLRAQNVSHDEAWTRSAAGAYVSGAMTAALTRAFPGGATAMLRPGAAAGVRKVLAEGIKNAALAIGKGILDEVPQEVLDEAFSQFTASTVEGRPLRDAVEDFVTGLPELIGASGLMGGGGAALEQFQGGAMPVSKAPDTPKAPAEAGTTNVEAALSGPAVQSAQAFEDAYATQERLRQSPAGAAALRQQYTEKRPDPRMAARETGADQVPMPSRASSPEVKAAARASIDAFSEAGMKPHQVEDTKAKAGVVMDIAQGAKLADLTDEQLRLVGLNRDGTAGHYQNEPVDKKDPSKGSTRVWKKGPRADGFQPVVVEDGELIITQRQIDNLKKKLPAVAQAIGLSEVERRKQIQKPAPAPAEAGTTNDETRIAPETAPATGADAAQGRAQEIAVAGDATARSGQALESPAPAELTAQAADDIPMAWDQSGERTDMVPEAQQSAVHPVLASAGFDAPALERANFIAAHLQDAGLSADEAAVAAGSVVRSMGVVGEDYTAQIVEDGFTQAMKAAGFQRRANMPTKWERKPSTERGEMTKATVIKKPSATPAAKRIPLIERADFKQAADKAMMGVFERLRGAPDKQKAAAEVKLLTNARNALVDLVDTQYGAFFDDVVVNSHGNGGGIQARATAFDPKTGRATAVVIEIDPETFLNHGSRSREGIERVLNEEFSHRIDLMVSSEQEAIDLAKSVHKARPGVFNAAWKQYFSVEITRGDMPAKPPAELTDRQAYQLYFEATRLIHQGTFTTENAEMPDIPLMRKIYLYLTRWVQTVQREMRKLPESVRSEWQWRIDQAESMMRKLQKAALAAEKAALDDVEPPESAVKKAKPPAKAERGSDPEMDADLEAAWESEQKSRRARPVFTPTQQALRNLRGLKDPDNGQINILSRISLEGGIAIYSEKVRKMRRQQGLPIGGDLDWLEQANLTPFWKGVIFRKGNAQNVDQVIQLLFDEGYFPQAAEQADVTGEMLAAKLEDVLSRYAAMKDGQGDLADADEQTGTEMSKLEAQRVAFDRATESGPIEVQAAELRVGDRMQVKGADGKLHPVEVIAVDIQPLPNGETFDPEGNPAHFYDANGRAVMLASVTLKDGTTFGVQQIDGEAGLFVDEFKVQQDYDWYANLRDAVLTGKLDEAEGLLHFMEHEGMGAEAAWSDILTALQSKLRLPMKKAQKMLAAVFDTTPKPSGPAELDTDNPLGSARKRATITPAQDADYLAAVEADDMAKAKRMVDEASSGYKIKGDYVEEDYEVIARTLLKHGNVTIYGGPRIVVKSQNLNATIDIEDDVLIVDEIEAREGAGSRMLADMIAAAKESGIETVKLTASRSLGGWFWANRGFDPVTLPAKEIKRRLDLLSIDQSVKDEVIELIEDGDLLSISELDEEILPSDYATLETKDKLLSILENKPSSLGKVLLVGTRWDAIKDIDGAIEAFPNGQIKSADPVTRDDAGNVIPLSQRFNPESDSILFSSRKRGEAGPSMFGEAFDLLSGDKGTRGLFEAPRYARNEETRMANEEGQAPDVSPSPSPQVSPSSDFSLESPTGTALDAEARRKELREKLQARQDKPLIGTLGDIGQGQLFGGGDLFAPPPAVDTVQNAPATPGTVEPDRPRNDAGKPGRPRRLQPAGGEADTDAGGMGQGGSAGQDTRVGGRAAPGGDAAAAGVAGAEPVQSEPSRVPASPAGSEQPAGSSGFDDPRAAVEFGAELGLPPVAPERPARDEVAAERESTPRQRQLEQIAVQSTPSVWDGFAVADAESIARSVPMLLPQQQQDVLKAERRFFEQQPTADDPKKGMLFTNGTGTGKTFTGLGIIKRFEMMGKGRILIVVPNQQKVADWKAEGERVMVKATPLKDTNDIGEDVVVTTYANMRDNWRLQAEPWDLVVYDESHNLSSNAQGTEGANIAAHELVTAKPGWNAMKKWIMAEIGPAPSWDDKDATARYENLAEQAWKRIQYRRDTAPETRAVFLSATPFAYHKNLKYADGFLYRSPEVKGTGYNIPQGFDKYLVENFGYSMRTNRLTSPGPEVDVGLMEREWAERQFKQGSMTGRMIDVPYDYSREFILLDSKTGQQLDEGFSALSGWGEGTTQQERERFRPLTEAFQAYWYGSSLGYTRRMQFLESIKVADALDRMNQHLDLGRKIVLFHSYNNAEPVHPFQLGYLNLDAKGRQLAQEWMKDHPAMVQMNFKRLENPRALVAGEFGERVRFFNGEEKGKDRSAAIKAFNDDNSGVDIIMVQMDAGKEGISLHDVTGAGKQRVLMNAALPVKPTDAIQTEGRIYRIGVKSNAIQEYLVLHTQMERSAFGSKISTRTGTVENMALGKMARTLTDSFKSGYLNAHSEAPSAEQGMGGKKQDAAELLGSDMDRAKSYYFGRMKKTSRTKAAEGLDYFATPEPVGLTMVRFLDAKAGDDLLEPSAGHGAIGRFFPDFTANKFVEPSRTLADELRIKVAAGKVEVMPFEDLHVGANKFDGIAMNPPFGTAGKLAMEHIAKAAQHLRQGGRLVAIIPEGPAMQKRFDQWLENEARDMHLRASYGLPTVTFERAGTSVKTRIVVLDKADLWTIKKEGEYAYFAVDSFGEKRTARQGDAASVRSLADRHHDFIGWSNQTTIQNRSPRELAAEDIKEFFDQLENLEPPARITKNVATGEVVSVPAPEPAEPAPLPAKPPSPLAAFLQGGRGAILPVSTPAAPTRAPITPAPVPEASKPLYEQDQTLHAKRGTMTYVAKMSRRISDAAFNAERSRAKKHGGYWSSFKANGAIPGFQFPSTEARDQFVTEGSSQTLASSRKRGNADEGVRAPTPVDAAAHEAATSPLNDLPEPTEAQREAGNYAKGHVRIAGHEISIENPAGSKRRPEWPALKDHYGYFKGTNAKDGDHVDVFVQPGTPADYAGPVHVIRQNKVESGQKTGTFDEYKVMLGYPTAEEARAAYLRNYEPGWPGLHKLTTHDQAEFQRIKDTLFTLPADRLPGVRESDKTLRQGDMETGRQHPPVTHTFPDGYQLTGPGLHTLGAGAKRAYHGTPHKVDKFSMAKIGTGEGAQAYGWGLYFAENRKVAEDYRWNLTKKTGSLVDGIPASTLGQQAWEVADDLASLGGDVDTYIAQQKLRRNAAIEEARSAGNKKRVSILEEILNDEISAAESMRGKQVTRGNLYTVELLPNEDEWLDWDKPMSEQGAKVKTRLQALWPEADLDAVGSGADMYRGMSGSKIDASNRLAKLGIPGIRYLDGNSRGKTTTESFVIEAEAQARADKLRQQGWKTVSVTARGFEGDGQHGRWYVEGQESGTSNYVIFDENLVRILEENGQPVNQALASAAKRGPVEKVASAVFSKAPVAVASGLAQAGSAVVEKAGLQPMLAKLGSNNLDKFISNVVFGKVAKWAKVENGKQAVEVWLGKPGLLSKLAKGALDQTVPLWNVPREWLAAYHESQRKAAWGREKAMDVIRALSHNAKVSDLAYPKEFVEDPAWRVKLFDAMEGKADMTTLPQPLQDLAERLRKLLRETGQELVRQGIMSLDTFEELSATGWMPRYTEEEAEAAGGSWLKAFKLGVKDLVAQRSTAWHVVDTTRKEKDNQYAIVSRDEGGKRNRWRFRNEQHRNAWYEDFIKGEAVKMLTTGGKDVTSLLAALTPDATRAVRDEIKKLTREKIDRPAELSENLRNVVKRAVELQRFRYKKESPFEPDKLIKDPVYSVARYVMGATHNAATMELLKVTAKNAEWVSDVALAGFKQMPDNDRFGPLAGKHVRDEIATQVLDLVDMPGTILGAYDSILRTWKAGKLVLNPGSHIRDAVGNVAFSVLAGSNPMNPGNLPYYRDAIAALRDGGDTYAELIEMQVLGGDAFTTEVKTALKGLLPDTKTTEGKPAGWIMRQIMGVGAGVRGGYEWAAAVRQIPDNLYKTAAYLKYKAAGMSPAEAAAEVRKWFPYYDRLGSSGLIKQGSRFVMPFSSFFRESTRILGRGAVERPLAMASILGLASGITQLSLMMLGLGDEDEESVFRAMRGKLKLGLSGDAPVFSMLLPMRTDDGQLQQWDISSVLPFADLLGTRVEMRQGEDEWTKFWRGLFTQSPILSTAWAWSTNTDAFSGRKIVEDDMGMLESTQERVRELGDTMLPPLTPWFGVHANTLNNAGRRMSTLETRNATQSYLRALVGLDVRSADPNLRTETEFFRKEKKLPLANDGSLYATPLKSRLGREIKSELIQDAPNIDTVADALLRLEESGNPIKTREDMEKLLKGLDPDRLIKEEYRRKLIQSFSPEALRVWRTQQSEFRAAQRRLPSVMSQVNPLVKARRAAGNP